MKLFAASLLVYAMAFFIACQTPDSVTNPEAPVGADIRLNTSSDAQPVIAHADDEAPRISLSDAKKAYDKGTAVFIDTRNEPFFLNERIKGAINIPVSSMAGRYKEVPKNKKVITYCS